jgi:multisubunit Na+/H+ antiporter MnhB subunit
VSGAELFDLVLAASLVVTGMLVLTSADFLRAAVLFIAFGLLMALAWMRLLAPDVALAEAAIGAGVTGVLLIDALRHMEWEREAFAAPREAPPPARTGSTARVRVPAGAAAAALCGAMVAAAWHLPSTPSDMPTRVRMQMEPLEQPVTAVLLLFRSFDTLLELGILLLAVLGMLVVRGRRGLGTSVALSPPRDPMLEATVRLLVPIAVCVGGYLLWLGTFAAGGAFQAGVVLGAAGMLLWLSGHRGLDAVRPWIWQALVALGFGVFLATAAAGMLWWGAALAYPRGSVSVMVEVLEGAAALSVAASVVVLFVGLHPSRDTSGGAGR